MTAVVGVMFPCTLYTRGHSTGPKLCGKLQNSSSLTSEVWNFLVLKVFGVLPGGRAAMINTAGKTQGRLHVSTPTAAGRGLKENISIKATLNFKSSIFSSWQTKHKYKLNINPKPLRGNVLWVLLCIGRSWPKLCTKGPPWCTSNYPTSTHPPTYPRINLHFSTFATFSSRG